MFSKKMPAKLVTLEVETILTWYLKETNFQLDLGREEETEQILRE